jgi:hypothetical protein
MLPLLISPLALLMLLAIAALPGPSGIVFIEAVDLAMFSVVQAIGLAEAGAKARAENAAARINRCIGKISLGMKAA